MTLGDFYFGGGNMSSLNCTTNTEAIYKALLERTKPKIMAAYDKETKRRERRKIRLIIETVVLIVLLSVLVSACHASTVPDNLWKGLIAEAVSEGPDGMYAVACVVRNRLNAGMNTGLVALKRKDLDGFVKREGRKTELIAKAIVEKVFYKNSPDVTCGATHYEAIQKYGTPRWARQMVVTTKIGCHTFYKQKGR
jgi:Cell wall hydrolyses involved in spore germination